MSKLIFFVDDDKMILNFVEYTLNNRGTYDIRTYQSGEDCLKNLNLKPDLIVLDHYLERSSDKYSTGFEILLEIKKLAPKTPIIILSSQDDKELIDNYLKSGASQYIPKNDYFIDILMESFDKEFKNQSNMKGV
ncbi:MAG: response regulator [Bacteroidales bacterium]|nr:response regulator [Bacteroidales bacterium]MCF8390989.1 response regulator [Bacteroidales bacterium]